MRAAGAIALALALAGCGPAKTPVARLIDDLAHDPAKLPERFPAETPVVLYLVGFSYGQIAREAGPLLMRGEHLALERALATKRDTQPSYWVVVADPQGKPRWWAGIEPVPKIHLTDNDPSGKPLPRGAELETVVAVRVPFYPEGKIEFYDPQGHLAGTIPFGAAP